MKTTFWSFEISRVQKNIETGRLVHQHVDTVACGQIERSRSRQSLRASWHKPSTWAWILAQESKIAINMIWPKPSGIMSKTGALATGSWFLKFQRAKTTKWTNQSTLNANLFFYKNSWCRYISKCCFLRFPTRGIQNIAFLKNAFFYTSRAETPHF